MKKDLFSSLSKKNFDIKKFKELKRILSKQGIEIKRKPFSNINFRFDEFKSLYLTGLASLLIVMFSLISPRSNGTLNIFTSVTFFCPSCPVKNSFYLEDVSVTINLEN